jgi:organic hydroperoxide reductase OsmC/OhrA
VAEARAKTLSFAASVDRNGTFEAEGCDPIELGEHWQAENLVLAGLVRCSITSLRYHAKRIGSQLEAIGSAEGTVTKRADDGRYAFVDIQCAIDAELAPAVGGSDLDELLAKAERDCFIGASLTTTPTYRWTINGGAVA